MVPCIRCQNCETERRGLILETTQATGEEPAHLTAYDIDTRSHIERVRVFCQLVSEEMVERGRVHDASKFDAAERLVFAANTAGRDQVAFGSPAYFAHLQTVRPALAHHYAANRHHPEHFEDGVDGMHLLDILEMVCDWMAASLRDTNDLAPAHRAVDMNQSRFGYSDAFCAMLHRTVDAIGARATARDAEVTACE